MPIEETIPNLNIVYQAYSNVFNNVENRIVNLVDPNAITNLMNFQVELIKFDSKLRLGMAVREIILNETYVREKIGDLRECHLMLYKLADIWFSYETFFKLYDLTYNRNLANRKILWLDNASNSNYSSDANIHVSHTRVNAEFKINFNTERKREALRSYLIYCAGQATGGQQSRLNILAQNIIVTNILQDYTHTDILSMTYAIRNNFAHNGEITVYPQEFSYVLKNLFLKILYKYLVVTTISATTITTEQRILNS